MVEARVVRRLAAIVAADMVGFSKLMEGDETGTLARLNNLRREVFDPQIGAHRGRIVKTTGDGMLLEFASVTDAAQCALDIQAELAACEDTDGAKAENGAGYGTGPMQFRIGINLGEIIIDGDDIYGNGVNIAARLEGLAEPGGVLISGTVYEHIRPVMRLAYRDLGLLSVKNISEPIRGYAIAPAVEDTTEAADIPPIPPEPALRPTVAVLPFENLSGDPEQEYFADGITEDIMAALSKSRWLLVSARNSSFAYKGQAVDIREVGRDLNAAFVLEGSVRRAGERIRCSVQMSDAATGAQVCAERYDRLLDDIFEVQDEITEAIVAQIEPELGAIERERARRKPTESLDAWSSYHLGLSKFYEYTRQGNIEAAELFERTIALDPDFAGGHAGLALTMSVNAVYFGRAEDAEYMDRAVASAETAISLDDKDAMFHFVLGRIHLIRKEYDASISDLRRAIQLNPCLATAHCGLGDSLSFSGRLAEAVPNFERAIRLSPHDPRKWLFLIYGSLTLMQLERYEEAAEWARNSAAQTNSTFWADVQMLAVQRSAGGPAATGQLAANLLRKEPNFSSRAFADQFLFYHHDPNAAAWYAGILEAAGLPA